MDSKRLRDLREAYGSIYEPEVELTEEQVWEEVETWVASLIEEGYDLSDYTWEEMFEAYLAEIGGIGGQKALDAFTATRAREVGDRATNQRAQLGVVKTNKGYIAKPGATSYDPNKGAEAIRLAARLNKETGLGRKPTATPTANPTANPPAVPSTPVLTAARASSSGSIAPRPATSAPAARPTATAPARPSSSATASTADKIKGGMDVYNKQKAAGDFKGATETGKSVWAASNPTLANKPKTPNPLMNKTFGYQTGNSPKEQQSRADAIINSGKVAAIKPKPTMQNQSYEWGSTSKLVDGIANAYSSIYEAKKVDQDKDGDNDFADVRIARLIASGVSKEEAIRRVKDKSYNEEVEIGEATRMRKELGKEGETATRKELASRSKAYQRSGSVDKTIAAAERGAKNPYVAMGKNETESDYSKRKQEKSKTLTRLASNRRGSVRDKPRAGLRGYAAKVEGSDRDLQSARSSARSAGTLTPAEKKGLGEDFELWVNQLVEEGYDLSDYTWDEMAEIYEETELEKKKAKEAAIAARRARVAELQSQGRVMTSTKRTRGAAAERKEAKRAEALERAANAILRQTTGSSGKVSDKPMGSEAPAPKEQAPEANRRLKTGLRRDTLGTAADDALKGVKKEEYVIYEAILDYLLENNFAETQDNADIIIENMSDEWAYEILEGYKKLPIAKMIKQAGKKGQNTGPLTYTGDENDYENRVRQINKMARVASRHSTIKGKAKVRGEGQALLNKIRGEK